MAKRSALIADIGGTNARFGIVDENGLHDLLNLECKDFDGPTEAAEKYLLTVGHHPRPDVGVFAVAGPVLGDLVNFTNLRWSFRGSNVMRRLKFNALEIMNDFKAVALAIPDIDPSLIQKIGGGEKMEGQAMGVLGPGTGLGVASLVWDGNHYVAQPGEGGHTTMAARNEREFQIFQELRVKYHHISAERVCSGKGLENLYAAIRALDKKSAPDLAAHEISERAIKGDCVISKEALDLMLVFLGRKASDLALTINAHSGVYIAGGIPTKLGDYFFNSKFMAEFISKGRMSEKMEQIPVYMIKHDAIGLLGVTAHAQKLLRN